MWLCQRVSHLASPLSSKLVGLRFFAAQLDWFLIVVLSGAPFMDALTGFCLQTQVVPSAIPLANERLVLKDSSAPEIAPIYVDFLSPKLIFRRQQGMSRREPFARALGLKSSTATGSIFALDVTAGMGVDAFMMACFGLRVVAIERSEIIFKLLIDGYRRLRVTADWIHRETGETILLQIAERLTFMHGSSVEVMATFAASDCPDIIYMDPMYPSSGRSKSALPKKEMQILRKLLGDDADAPNLLSVARNCARNRVVVKRPLYAEHLGDLYGHTIEGKTARFDIYRTA